jgi:hypothetical protein
MVIKRIKIADIRLAKYNPRKDLRPGDPAFDRLKKAIDSFDLVEPLVWNKRTGNLVGGHQRLKILAARGDTEVSCSVVDLDDRQERVLNLALNKQSGEWDRTALADLFKTIDEADIEAAGFTAAEVESICSALPDSVTKSSVKPLAVDSLPQLSWILITIPTVRFGEIAERIGALADLPGVTVETTVTDVRKHNKDGQR